MPPLRVQGILEGVLADPVLARTRKDTHARTRKSGRGGTTHVPESMSEHVHIREEPDSYALLMDATSFRLQLHQLLLFVFLQTAGAAHASPVSSGIC